MNPIDLGDATVFKQVEEGKAKVDKQELEKIFGNAPAVKKEGPAGGDAGGPGKGAGSPMGIGLPGLASPGGGPGE